ncbi:HAMP domain-containing sensor histidine kinase [Peribacillus simplex]|uniref:histidine kinase n=2 Tax=Peribacillus TaxID=2675229 RepID=A0AA90P6M6_9BACI|nr:MULTISPECIES: HAMP domain-containing sensor histidine kinase [Peribacillus]MDP1421872.1 HAMP domain-containing sensor histidine kinase [Peribacillus simplex]MDP1454524.1 HAMP domain-containing sensor histidine kinase [Peribacillus frigoritolerans]
MVNAPFSITLNNFITEYHTLIIFILVIFSSGWILSKPLFHILEWINMLAQDKYYEPVDKNGFVRSKSRKSRKIKYTFILYKNIIQNLKYLTSILEENKMEREKIEKLKQEWVADIAHDLKTPLSYVKGYSSMLLSNNQWTDEDRRNFLIKIEEKSEYMESLLIDLNDMFEFDSQPLNVKKEQHDLVDFIREVIIELANDPMTEGYNFQFLNKMKGNFPYSFSPSAIKRVLHNLLTNAIIHNPNVTNIDIQLEKDDVFVVIVIKDNGTGVEKGTLKHIFNRYQRGTSDSSSGLGMTIAKQFVEAHQGNISIESEVGKGTSVSIHLPL